MEKEFKIISGSNEDLKLALKLVYEMCYGMYIRSKRDDFGVLTWGFDNDNGLCLSYNRTNVCDNAFPTILTDEMLYPIIVKFLSGFDKDEKYAFGDGSTGRGFSIEYGGFGHDYDFKVKFETMYYGK